jgi:hypothetical protein
MAEAVELLLLEHPASVKAMAATSASEQTKHA